tara:strand:+ start:1089 stop:1739 length:651 start_codon:yes stop_codon:yes gene_type:complete
MFIIIIFIIVLVILYIKNNNSKTITGGKNYNHIIEELDIVKDKKKIINIIQLNDPKYKLYKFDKYIREANSNISEEEKIKKRNNFKYESKLMDTKILDIRTKKEINKGHLCYALLFYSFIDKFKNIDHAQDVRIFINYQPQFADLYLQLNSPSLLIYCNSGKRALKAAKIISKLKFNNLKKIYVITNGGYSEIEDIINKKYICSPSCELNKYSIFN